MGAVRTKNERRQGLARKSPTESRFTSEQEETTQRSARDTRKNAERRNHTEDQDQPELGEAAGSFQVGHWGRRL